MWEGLPNVRIARLNSHVINLASILHRLRDIAFDIGPKSLHSCV